MAVKEHYTNHLRGDNRDTQNTLHATGRNFNEPRIPRYRFSDMRQKKIALYYSPVQYVGTEKTGWRELDYITNAISPGNAGDDRTGHVIHVHKITFAFEVWIADFSVGRVLFAIDRGGKKDTLLTSGRAIDPVSEVDGITVLYDVQINARSGYLNPTVQDQIEFTTPLKVSYVADQVPLENPIIMGLASDVYYVSQSSNNKPMIRGHVIIHYTDPK